MKKVNIFIVIAIFIFSPSFVFGQQVRWSGGLISSRPVGKILTDNSYGLPSILTGVTYHYIGTEPTNPADHPGHKNSGFGNRLLDGHVAGNWYTPVGMSHKPLKVAFDFNRPCTFNEIDVYTRYKKPMQIKLAVRSSKKDKWKTVAKIKEDKSYNHNWHRVMLDEPAKGRYLRLWIKSLSGSTTYVSEVMAWGDAKVSKKYPTVYKPVRETRIIVGTAAVSIPGIPGTSFSDAYFRHWRRNMQSKFDGKKVLWSRLPTWGRWTSKPLLPHKKELVHRLNFKLARGASGYAALALTNTKWKKPLRATVKLSGFHRIKNINATSQNSSESKMPHAVIHVGGAIPSRNYGNVISPLFAPGNTLGEGMMRKYLTNGAGIANFPQLTLSRAGSAILWLYIDTTNVAPGVYKATLTATPKDASPSKISILVKVVDIKLPNPHVWVNTWSTLAQRFPFASIQTRKQAMKFKQRLGATVWAGFPTRSSVQELARETGRAIFYRGILPHGYRKLDLSKKKNRQKVIDKVHKVVSKAKSLGLDYDQWFASLWDEPSHGSIKKFHAYAKLIHKTDPKVRIYCNPAFWGSPHHGTDKLVYSDLRGWYDKLVDISVPLTTLLHNKPNIMSLFSHPRSVNAYYSVISQSSKSNNKYSVTYYRRMAWNAFKRGWNGWGFYSYYQPRGNPWNDLDSGRPDYTIVYPGPKHAIPTRATAAMRRGWDDYRLLTLLKKQGQFGAIKQFIKQYEAGKSLDKIRLEALNAAIKWAAEKKIS